MIMLNGLSELDGLGANPQDVYNSKLNEMLAKGYTRSAAMSVARSAMANEIAAQKQAAGIETTETSYSQTAGAYQRYLDTMRSGGGSGGSGGGIQKYLPWVLGATAAYFLLFSGRR
jgi:hypothetical protein